MVPHRKQIYVAATVDTKGAEAHFVKDRIADAGLAAVVVDLSTRAPGLAAARSPRWRLHSSTTSGAATTSPR